MIPSSFFFSFPLYIPRSQTGFERSPGIFAQRGPISSLTKPTTFSGPLKNPQISPPKIPIKIISRNRESTRWHHEDPVTSRDLEPRVSDTRQSWGTRGISPCPKVREKKIGGPPRSRDAHIADWLKTSSDLPKKMQVEEAMFWQRYLFVCCSTRWLNISWNAISPLPVRSMNRICQEGIEEEEGKEKMVNARHQTAHGPTATGHFLNRFNDN